MSTADSDTILQSVVNHLAIIPDGNRRWAKSQGIFGTLKMYDQGADRAAEVIRAAFEHGVTTVSFWGSSAANLTKRNGKEVEVLERIYSVFSQKLINEEDVHKHEVRVEIIGKWKNLLGEATIANLQKVVDDTKQYNKRRLVLLIGYDGVDERSAAVESILQTREDTDIDGNTLLRQHSWTGHIPDVDLIIRTGAWEDPHNSVGFLSLLTDNTQYAFPQVLWPDFKVEKLQEVLDDFNERERRLGK
ncbi:TPA: di-trans,poly-cis-decaprenylcistransferase [Candidatus Saccharibacteria bacterium]|nr:di-trans,poly-cis-decaprenylcistransferase [Candidatus Saccharibacteria bacterium]HIO87725.1 di-trans,poly-cis-decaprenylcistransferase [Candidatus Saccharibacteria bacterium]